MVTDCCDQDVRTCGVEIIDNFFLICFLDPGSKVGVLDAGVDLRILGYGITFGYQPMNGKGVMSTSGEVGLTFFIYL